MSNIGTFIKFFYHFRNRFIGINAFVFFFGIDTIIVQKGFAYEVNGDVYFRVNKIKDYGTLSNMKIDDLVGYFRDKF